MSVQACAPSDFRTTSMSARESVDIFLSKCLTICIDPVPGILERQGAVVSMFYHQLSGCESTIRDDSAAGSPQSLCAVEKCHKNNPTSRIKKNTLTTK